MKTMRIKKHHIALTFIVFIGTLFAGYIFNTRTPITTQTKHYLRDILLNAQEIYLVQSHLGQDCQGGSGAIAVYYNPQSLTPLNEKEADKLKKRLLTVSLCDRINKHTGVSKCNAPTISILIRTKESTVKAIDISLPHNAMKVDGIQSDLPKTWSREITNICNNIDMIGVYKNGQYEIILNPSSTEWVQDITSLFDIGL